jgi:hypothetical protein
LLLCIDSCLGLLLPPSFVLGLLLPPPALILFGIITILIFDLITVLILDLRTVLDFRDYSGEPSHDLFSI